MTSTIVDKRAATGALIGLALGDALGFPTEFNDIPSILAKFGPWRQLPLIKPAIVSDDTQMTLAVARGMRTAMDRGALGPEDMAVTVRQEFIAWNRSPDNNRAPGNTCLRACELLENPDLPWQDASQLGSKGCGANMRVAPVGLAPGLSDEQRAGAAQLQAALTHGHPTALAASDLTGRAVHLLAQGTEPAALLEQLRSYAEENRGHYHQSWLGDLWTRGQDAGPEEFIARGWRECLAILDRLEDAVRTFDPEADPCLATGAGWIAEEALATGLLCFLGFPDEPVTAIRRAAYSSGDSDSIACLAGAFAGAHRGSEAWPTEWADRIEYQSDLMTLGALWDS